MRALLVMIVLAVATPVMADEVAAPVPVEIKPGHAVLTPEPSAIDENKPVGHPRPSGYWTGYRPAKGGAYRWRLLGIAAVVLGITIVMLVRMLRRVSATRAS